MQAELIKQLGEADLARQRHNDAVARAGGFKFAQKQAPPGNKFHGAYRVSDEEARPKSSAIAAIQGSMANAGARPRSMPDNGRARASAAQQRAAGAQQRAAQAGSRYKPGDGRVMAGADDKAAAAAAKQYARLHGKPVLHL